MIERYSSGLTIIGFAMATAVPTIFALNMLVFLAIVTRVRRDRSGITQHRP